MIQTQDIVRLLGGSRTVGRRVTTSVELEQDVSAGLKREALDHLLRFVAPEGERSQLRNRSIAR